MKYITDKYVPVDGDVFYTDDPFAAATEEMAYLAAFNAKGVYNFYDADDYVAAADTKEKVKTVLATGVANDFFADFDEFEID